MNQKILQNVISESLVTRCAFFLLQLNHCDATIEIIDSDKTYEYMMLKSANRKRFPIHDKIAKCSVLLVNLQNLVIY